MKHEGAEHRSQLRTLSIFCQTSDKTRHTACHCCGTEQLCDGGMQEESAWSTWLGDGRWNFLKLSTSASPVSFSTLIHIVPLHGINT